eukprot:TRINITY_DN5240_c0_g1_i2.p1 TRINITY_DN5240_c0_g1~~TRINITY_DN5240_c0_g1_i2.p1  ORF type:complete len:639 (-),score=136.63 TRINITY_DN5240_c0_g1_i2:136-2052(-)
MNPPYASASLYVGDLPTDITEANLFEVFNQVGPVASIRVCRDAVTRRSLGYAYVNFHAVVDAERALDALNNTPIKGRPCRIMWSQRDPALRKSGVGNVFIKNLHKSIDHKLLYDTFSAFGNILSCKVVTDDGNSSKGYGFVHFESAESAEKAIQKVNGMFINGQKVYVGYFIARKERVPTDTEQKFTNVYVKNLDLSVTEDEIRDLFKEFGTVTNSAIMKDSEGKSKGFAFVNFETPEAAKAAVDALNGKELKTKTIYVGRAQKKSEREAELKAKFEQQRSERASKYQGVNLYIKNLEDNVEDDRLRAEFSSFGTITSAKVMRDDKNGSRGFGFVCYASPDEATRAVTEMNGKMLGAKPLYVALAQRKDIRKAQLEAQHAQRAKSGLPTGPGMGRLPPGAPLAPGIYPPGAPMFYAQPNTGLPGAQIMYPPGGQMMPRQRMYPGPQGGYQVPPHYVVAPGSAPGSVQQRAPGIRGPRAPLQQGGMPGMKGAPSNGQRRPNPTGSGRGSRIPGDGLPPQNINMMPVPIAQQMLPTPEGIPMGVPVVHSHAPIANETTPAPLTVQGISAYPQEQQRMILGERLYPLVHVQQPDLAGKITGMLLDSFDVTETIQLIENHDALNAKIVEAVDVLKAHQQTTA